MKLIQTLIFSVACLVSLTASAQWQWLDKDGHKVFSDRAPPADIPEKNILKQPHSRGKTIDVPAANSMPAPVSPIVGTTKPVGADKELTEKKKQAADAEAAKRKADEERIAKIQAENCARARQTKAGLEAGLRVTRTNEKGEREFLDDAGRAEEARRIQTLMDEDCK